MRVSWITNNNQVGCTEKGAMCGMVDDGKNVASNGMICGLEVEVSRMAIGIKVGVCRLDDG